MIGSDPSGNGFIKSVRLRIFPQMGFSVVRSGITMLVQRLGQCLLSIGQSRELFAVVQLLVIPLGTSTEPLGQIGTRWILPGQNARATRRADVARRVGVVEQHAFFCQLIDRRSFIKLAAVATYVPLAKIVDQKEDHIGFLLRV